MQRASTYEVISFFHSQSDCQSILSPTYYHPTLITISPPSLYPHQTPLHRLFNTPGSQAPNTPQRPSNRHTGHACEEL